MAFIIMDCLGRFVLGPLVLLCSAEVGDPNDTMLCALAPQELARVFGFREL